MVLITDSGNTWIEKYKSRLALFIFNFIVKIKVLKKLVDLANYFSFKISYLDGGLYYNLIVERIYSQTKNDTVGCNKRVNIRRFSTIVFSVLTVKT